MGAEAGLTDAIAMGTAARAEIDAAQKYYYGDVTLVGGFEPSARDYDRTAPAPYGLAPLWQAWYGALRGESGNYYMPVRFNHVMMTPRLHLPRTPMGGPSEDVAEARSSFYGYTSNDVVDGRWVVQSRGKPERSCSFVAEPGGSAVWDEANILHLELEYLGPAMQMYHPDPRHDWYYVANVNRISGEILGDPVVGVGGFELAWAGGGALEWRELAVPTRCEEIWMIYANRFADGGFEAAALYGSRSGRGAGLLLGDGGAEPLRGITTDVETDGQGRPVAALWETAGRTWRWEAENPASLTSPRNPSYIWMFGSCRELTSDRPIEESLVYAEILPRAIRPPE